VFDQRVAALRFLKSTLPLGVGQKFTGLDRAIGLRKFISEISRSLVYEPGPP